MTRARFGAFTSSCVIAVTEATAALSSSFRKNNVRRRPAFAPMRAARIRHALAFDAHLASAGSLRVPSTSAVAQLDLFRRS
jgi:hypothetical protein